MPAVVVPRRPPAGALWDGHRRAVDVDHPPRARGLLQATARCLRRAVAGLPRARLELADAGGVVVDRGLQRGDLLLHLAHRREQSRPPRREVVGEIGGAGGGAHRQQWEHEGREEHICWLESALLGGLQQLADPGLEAS
jgi:hypothetical protein